MVITELNSTRTARWYDSARKSSRADAWAERLRCYRVLSELLAEQAVAQAAAQASVQASAQGWLRAGREASRHQYPEIAPRGLITEVARRVNFTAHETVYKRFRSQWEGPIPRWAGTENLVKPRNALVAEAKIVSFWPYRDGVLQSADLFDRTLHEFAEAYLCALAAWAANDIGLAACRPAGPPPCVAEDMEVLAREWLQRQRGATSVANPVVTPVMSSVVSEKARQLGMLAQTVVGSVLDDPAITPAAAFDGVRDELSAIFALPMDPVAGQLGRAAVQLTDRLLHQAPGEVILTPEQADHLLTVLTGLNDLLGRIVTAECGCAFHDLGSRTALGRPRRRPEISKLDGTHHQSGSRRHVWPIRSVWVAMANDCDLSRRAGADDERSGLGRRPAGRGPARG